MIHRGKASAVSQMYLSHLKENINFMQILLSEELSISMNCNLGNYRYVQRSGANLHPSTNHKQLFNISHFSNTLYIVDMYLDIS